MSNYFQVDAYSASAIKAGAKSMLQMHHFMTTPSFSSAAMQRGTLMHLAILEPEKLEGLVISDLNRNTKAFKELAAEHGKHNIVKSYEAEELRQAQAMVLNHGEAARLLNAEGKSEVEKYWIHNGVACKAKIDFETDDFIVEYKTTGNLDSFLKTCANLKYNLQLAWYWEACGRKPVFIISQEQKAPFDVAVFEVPQLQLQCWLQDCWDIVEHYELCKVAGKFPGAYQDVMSFELPSWAQDVKELEIDEISF